MVDCRCNLAIFSSKDVKNIMIYFIVKYSGSSSTRTLIIEKEIWRGSQNTEHFRLIDIFFLYILCLFSDVYSLSIWDSSPNLYPGPYSGYFSAFLIFFYRLQHRPLYFSKKLGSWEPFLEVFTGKAPAPSK